MDLDEAKEKFDRAVSILIARKEDYLFEAEKLFLKIEKRGGVSADLYARSQGNLALIYREKNDIPKAIQAYERITKIDSPKAYARAQLEIGIIYFKKNNIKKANEYYKIISLSDSPTHYAYAQWNLYVNTGEELYLHNIKLNQDLECYAEAQLKLGLLETLCLKKYEFWKNIPKHSELYIKERHQIDVVESIAKVVNSKYQDQLYGVFESISSILESLFVDNRYEQFIAHYTNLTVSKLLLTKQEDDKKFKLKSTLRLNTINLMNDPEEGLLINKLLFLDSKIVTQDSAFITCFTLHHDSLNQFRLYAKEAQQEASGLSLVLGKEFFAKEHNAASIYEKSKLERVESLDKNIDAEETNKKNALAAMPLYRCIYFDPTSGLVKVAQREEWSFRREFKLENKHQWFDENPSAEEKWQEYNQKVTEIEKSVKLGLKELSALVEKLRIDQLNEQEKEVLAEIFLPLRYLIKNMAFKEEQECRIVYVTQMDNPLIQYDEKINRIYIDYAPSVMEHLEKIYIAPKAKDEKMVFEYLCSRGQEIRKGKKAVKVKISQNPFR